jgi:hypothetical protein
MFAHFLDSVLLCSDVEIVFFWLPASAEEKVDDAVLRRHTSLRLLYWLLVAYFIKKRCVTSLFTSIVLVISTGLSAGPRH